MSPEDFFTRMEDSPIETFGLVEVKWTRTNLEKALRMGKKSITMLKKACRQGVWSRSRSKVKASMVGVMVVMPGQWCCILSSAGGSEWTRYPVAREQSVRKRRGGKSQSGAQKRKTRHTTTSGTTGMHESMPLVSKYLQQKETAPLHE